MSALVACGVDADSTAAVNAIRNAVPSEFIPSAAGRRS